MKTLFSVFIGMLVCTGITLAQQNNTGVIDKNIIYPKICTTI